VVSVGRGTQLPFQIYGHPQLHGNYSFTPVSTPGASLHPKLEGRKCNGRDLSVYATKFKAHRAQLHFQWLLNAYHQLGAKGKFFKSYFDRLAGNGSFRKQIEQGFSEKRIRRSWRKDIKAFMKIRQGYLLYP